MDYARPLPKSSLENILPEICKRPLTYLPERNVRSLFAFITGWLLASGSDDDDALMKEFYKYVEHEYGMRRVNIFWYEMIEALCPDQQETLGKFFEVYDKFIKSRDAL